MKSTFYHGKLYDMIKEMEVDGMSVDLNNKCVRNYLAFMYNEDNIHNCSECPENRNEDSWGGKMPCGQQNCWVKAHCQSKEEEK